MYLSTYLIYYLYPHSEQPAAAGWQQMAEPTSTEQKVSLSLPSAAAVSAYFYK